jgi:1-acyl-sn-glycerol-3-phosphate acyltransferase
MATPTTQFDRAAVEQQVLAAVRELLIELGSHRAIEDLRVAAHLEKDLALGSLERVELISRLSREFLVELPDRLVAEADTVADLIGAIAKLGRASVAPFPELHATPGAVSREVEVLPGGPGPLLEAATLLDVLRHRGTVDSARTHILLSEPGDPAPRAAPRTRRITFGQLYQGAQAIARGLHARGLQPGDTVALMLPTSPEFFDCFMGVLLAGGIAVPIYPPLRPDRLEEYAYRQSAILRNAEVRFLIASGEAGAVVRLLQPHVPSLQGVFTPPRLASTTNGAAEVVHHARGRDIAFLQYTSGSTGEPKGVILTHSNLLANIRAIVSVIQFTAQDVGLTWLPLYHDMGLIGTWLTPLYFGIPVVVMSPLEFLTHPERWLWAVHNHRASLSAAPNFAFELCVRKIRDEDIQGLDLSSWRAVLNGAEPVKPSTLDRFCERFSKYGFRPEALLPVYGLAEATLAVTIPRVCAPDWTGWKVDRVARARFERSREAVPAAPDDPSPLEFVSVGPPVPGYEVRIVDDAGRDLPERVEGALWFRGPAATQGYYRNPSATREIQKGDGWIDSGDRAYRAGGEFFITGRAKDIIIKAGRNIYPQEVEEAASEVEGVRRGNVVAFGIADEQSGTERLVVVAEARAANASQNDAVKAAIAGRVTEVIGIPPDVVELVPPQSIPKTSSGKLRRSETRRLFLAGVLGAGRPPVWLQVARLAATGGARAARSGFRRLVELLYGVWSAIAFAIFLLPTWTLAYFAPSKEMACRVTQIGTRIFFRLILVPITVRGWENIPPGRPCVFVSNHTSFFDVLLFLALFKFPYRFVSKQEVAHWPFIGTFIRRRTDFAFNRSDPNARLEQAELLERSIREGVSLLVFPEGTFVAAAGVRPFQLGAFKTAVATGAPVVPIALHGVRDILRDETTLPKPGRITVTILPPLHPNPAAPEFQEIIRLRDAARAAIAAHCGEHLQ